MELKNGLLPIHKLILGCLKIANQAFGAVLAVFICVILLNLCMWAVVAGAVFVFGQMGSLLQIPASLLQGFLNMMLMMAIIQLIAAKMEKTGLTIGESLVGSIRPAFYMILSSLIIGIPLVLIIVAASFSKSPLIIGLVILALSFILLPLVFTQTILALRDEGPISAIQYSWHIGTKYYLRILGILLTITAIMIVIILAIVCVLKAFLPQLFVQPQLLQFQLMGLIMGAPKLYLVLGGIVCLLFYGYLIIFGNAIYTAIFLNLDYCERPIHNREMTIHEQQQEIIPVVPAVAVTPEIEVKQASVQTQTDEHTDMHLEKVYSANEHAAQFIEQEEDRMPTILFDDEMARQLAENDRQVKERAERAAQQNSSTDDGQESIKMSGK